MKINLKKTHLLLIGDILAIVVLLIMLVKMSALSEEINKTRSELVKYTPVNVDTVKVELSKLKNKEGNLKSSFPKEIQLIDFINGVSQIKSNNILKNFSFPVDNVIKDKTGFTGLPVLFSFSGTQEELNNSVQSIQNLPYFIRPVDYKLTVSEASKSATLDYGGFLYTDENFKN